ncbi:hypothetical protein D9758_007505 [Tetrapyrgos nigripes]|uniref:Uncharacterized protein n=1 Tax=Tetrapyrgos nigripes TaxID=182062 RepID=A0A8H5G3G3_9AGAR|nr:hypothetical protein D9758_007505 [Tetrapyrgos nigripes]
MLAVEKYSLQEPEKTAYMGSIKDSDASPPYSELASGQQDRHLSGSAGSCLENAVPLLATTATVTSSTPSTSTSTITVTTTAASTSTAGMSFAQRLYASALPAKYTSPPQTSIPSNSSTLTSLSSPSIPSGHDNTHAARQSRMSISSIDSQTSYGSSPPLADGQALYSSSIPRTPINPGTQMQNQHPIGPHHLGRSASASASVGGPSELHTHNVPHRARTYQAGTGSTSSHSSPSAATSSPWLNSPGSPSMSSSSSSPGPGNRVGNSITQPYQSSAPNDLREVVMTLRPPQPPQPLMSTPVTGSGALSMPAPVPIPGTQTQSHNQTPVTVQQTYNINLGSGGGFGGAQNQNQALPSTPISPGFPHNHSPVTSTNVGTPVGQIHNTTGQAVSFGHGHSHGQSAHSYPVANPMQPQPPKPKPPFSLWGSPVYQSTPTHASTPPLPPANPTSHTPQTSTSTFLPQTQTSGSVTGPAANVNTTTATANNSSSSVIAHQLGQRATRWAKNYARHALTGIVSGSIMALAPDILSGVASSLLPSDLIQSVSASLGNLSLDGLAGSGINLDLSRLRAAFQVRPGVDYQGIINQIQQLQQLQQLQQNMLTSVLGGSNGNNGLNNMGSGTSIGTTGLGQNQQTAGPNSGSGVDYDAIIHALMKLSQAAQNPTAHSSNHGQQANGLGGLGQGQGQQHHASSSFTNTQSQMHHQQHYHQQSGGHQNHLASASSPYSSPGATQQHFNLPTQTTTQAQSHPHPHPQMPMQSHHATHPQPQMHHQPQYPQHPSQPTLSHPHQQTNVPPRPSNTNSYHPHPHPPPNVNGQQHYQQQPDPYTQQQTSTDGQSQPQDAYAQQQQSYTEDQYQNSSSSQDFSYGDQSPGVLPNYSDTPGSSPGFDYSGNQGGSESESQGFSSLIQGFGNMMNNFGNDSSSSGGTGYADPNSSEALPAFSDVDPNGMGMTGFSMSETEVNGSGFQFLSETIVAASDTGTDVYTETVMSFGNGDGDYTTATELSYSDQ